ncbi:hypothetical protein CYMTET_19722 [Cymbomonas tetramitiformis]|uniref:Uncharacterized protein n=1 Tax=Cymbomonas tetramitiformis TaxID=36881 RepID=A0AAE0L503_9CHLO|nr:hypothetical protein CYMTET_19722 [Cymbomonas tetramitiformis]
MFFRAGDTTDYAATPLVGTLSSPARSKRVNENVDSTADLLGVSYSLIFEGGCAMSGPNVVVVQSPVTEEKVEIVFVETGFPVTARRHGW